MKLSICIPQYSETDEIVRPLLDSIAIQQGVDFGEIETVIVNDGSDTHLTAGLLQRYPFAIRYIMKAHRGVSAARNTAMDAAAGEYVMFCDADDMILSACGLAMVFREMEDGFDTLWSVFAEETRTPEGKPVFIERERDTTFVHGKVHRKKFLEDHDLRWNEALWVHEDGYFHSLIQCMGPETRYCERPWYLWRWRDGSACRSPLFTKRTFPQLIDARQALTEELIRRGMEDRATDVAAQTVLDAYYGMQMPEWDGLPALRQAAEERFAAFYKKHGHRFEKLPAGEKARLSGILRQKKIRVGMELERVTLGEWLAAIGRNA